MKKQLLSLGLIASSFTAFAQQDCTSDITAMNDYLNSFTPAKTWGGLPDTAQNLPLATAGQQYSETLNFKLPAMASDVIANPPIDVPIQTISIKDMQGLPPGLVFTSAADDNDNIFCDGQGSTAKDCLWDGGAYACVKIEGTPSTVGVYPVTVILEGTTVAGAQDSPLTGYVINVTSAGVDLINQDDFAVSQNAPNPFNGSTDINYMMDNAGAVSFSVMNLLGETVYSNEYSANKGVNTITFNGNDLNDGIYMYTVKTGAKKVTKRMIVRK